MPHTLHWTDAHLDLAYLALGGRDLMAPLPDDCDGCLTLPALRSGSVTTVFGTIFTEPVFSPRALKSPELYLEGDADGAESAGQKQLRIYEKLQLRGEIHIVRGFDDLKSSLTSLNLVLLMEGADPIHDPEDAIEWFDHGVRIIGLTWAAGTRYAGGNRAAPGEGPLTPLGIELVLALDEVGIIHDVSHLSDAAFDGLMEHARGPIMASHSNCRALLDENQRHLRDDQIAAIIKRRGVIGLNLYSKFLVNTGQRATIADCVRHIEHICGIAGHSHAVGLGSDMDGGFAADKLPIGLDHPSRFSALADALCAAGWKDHEVEGFAWRNWREFLQRALPVTTDPAKIQARPS